MRQHLPCLWSFPLHGVSAFTASHLFMFSHNKLIVVICFQNSFVPSFLQTYQLKTIVKLSWQTQLQFHMSMISHPSLFFFFFVVFCFSSALTTTVEMVFVWVLGNGQGVEMLQLLLYRLWKHNGKKWVEPSEGQWSFTVLVQLECLCCLISDH